MTTTLLKHEWLRTRGVLGMFSGIVTLVVIAGALLSTLGSVLAVLGLIVAILGLFILIPGTQLLLAADYWRSGYGRTGYFTQSIPVRGSTIFWAKLAWVMIASLAATVLTGVLGLFGWWMLSVRQTFDTPSPAVLGDVWATITDAAPLWMIVAGGLLVLASVLYWPIQYCFAISFGHERRLAGLGAAGPIVVYVALYVITQVAIFVGMVLIPLGVGAEGGRLTLVSFNVLDEMSAGVGASGDVMPLGFIVMMLLLGVFCLWRTARSWNHKVALR